MPSVLRVGEQSESRKSCARRQISAPSVPSCAQSVSILILFCVHCYTCNCPDALMIQAQSASIFIL